MKKKLLTLALLSTIIFVGCGSKNTQTETKNTKSENSKSDNTQSKSDENNKSAEVSPAPLYNQEFEDQNGNKIKLSDFKGKKIFLNFFKTNCGPCVHELPEMINLYESNGSNKDDLVVLAVANPYSDKNDNAIDVPKEELVKFIKENKINFPVILDYKGDLYREYLIRATPTTFMINKDGNIYGYTTGAMNYDTMQSIVDKTK